MRKRKAPKGFGFKPDIEYIRQTMDMPAHSKLEWLEEAKAFTYNVLPRKKIKIWEKFKRGKF